VLIGTTLTLVLNAAQTIADPQQKTGGPPSVAVQMQNASSFAIEVLTEGDQYFIQPFTAQTVPVSGQPVTITPVLQQGLSAATPLTPVWLLANESPPMQDGPLTAAALQAALNGLVTQPFDKIGSDPVTVVPPIGSGPGSFVSAALHQYACILVQVLGNPTGPIVIQVTNTTKGLLSASQTIPNLPGASTAAFENLYFPIPANQGDSIQVSFSTLNGSSTSASIYAYGLGFGLQPTPLRPDGRLGPLGTLTASELTYTANTPAIVSLPASVPAQGCVLLQTASIYPTGNFPTTGYMRLGAIVNGSLVPIATALFPSGASDWANVMDVPDGGILCDPGEPVSFYVLSDATAQLNAVITYDLVA
jgi:hypothetical protein